MSSVTGEEMRQRLRDSVAALEARAPWEFGPAAVRACTFPVGALYQLPRDLDYYAGAREFGYAVAAAVQSVPCEYPPRYQLCLARFFALAVAVSEVTGVNARCEEPGENLIGVWWDDECPVGITLETDEHNLSDSLLRFAPNITPGALMNFAKGIREPVEETIARLGSTLAHLGAQ